MQVDPWLLRAAAANPDRVAVQTPDLSVTYAELEARARAAAGALLSRGVGRGDRVALALPAGLDFVVALHGCLLLGAVAVPIDLRLGEGERAARMGGVVASVGGPLDGPPVKQDAIVSPSLDEVATLMHTSGTTAAPKPVELTYGNWLWNALGSAVALGLDPAERWLCPMTPVHVGGLSILVRSTIYATTVVLTGGFDTDLVAGRLSDTDSRITLVSLVPTMLARLLDAALQRPPALRWVLLGGGPIPPALLHRAAAAGVPVAPTYGMTEACSQIVTGGLPLAGVQLRISDSGEILVRGPIVAPGALAADGWLHTGDLGELDARGRLTVVGRASDTIVTGGENVAPVEVEAALLEHPAVADVAVHPRADTEWGERVVASVVVHHGAEVTAAELVAHCAERLAPFKVPKSVELVESLPRNAAGKLLRGRLK